MKKGKYVIISAIILSVVVGAGFYRYYQMEIITDTVVTELGEPLSTNVTDYAKGNLSNAKLDLAGVNVQKAGLYKALITNGSKNIDLSIEVADTTPPTATVTEGLEFLTYKPVNAADLVTDINDASNSVSIVFEDNKEIHTYTKGGEVRETIILTDSSGNKSSFSVKFQVIADTSKPVLKGIKPFKVFTGDKVDYTKGVEASDDRDGDLTANIKVDTKKVDLQTPGKYIIEYLVSDRSGNETRLKSSLMVMQDKAPVLKGLSDKTVYINSKINYLKGAVATDDRDGNITSKIQVNSEKVNITKAGSYKAIYTVMDSAGNKTVKTIIVTVKKKATASSGHTKTPKEKDKAKPNKNSNKDSSGSFKFFNVKPEKGPDVDGDVPAGGKQDVGTWG